MCDNHICELYFAIINVILSVNKYCWKFHCEQPVKCLIMLIIMVRVKLFKKLFGL